MKNNINLTLRNTVVEKVNVEIKDMSFYCNEDNDIYVHGGIWTKEGYNVLKKHRLVIKGDILDCQGRILYTLRDRSDRCLEIAGYDSFELYCCSVNRFVEIDKMSEIKVYAVMERKS